MADARQKNIIIIREAAQKHGLTFDHAYYCRKGTGCGGRDIAGWTAQTNRGQFTGPTPEAVVAEIDRLFPLPTTPALPSGLCAWLGEERTDGGHRRRFCLGCGDSQEFPAKGPAPTSYVEWHRRHRACGEGFTPIAPERDAPDGGAARAGSTGGSWTGHKPLVDLPTCPKCGFAGVTLTEAGTCEECTPNICLAADYPGEETGKHYFL